MRIFYFSTEPVPGTHGGSIHTWEVARHLAWRGHAVTAGVPRMKGQPAEETLERVRIVRWPMRFFGKSAPILALPWAAREGGARYDAVISRFSLFGGADALLARRAGAPLVIELNHPHLAELLHKLRVPGLAPALKAWHWFLAGRADAAITTCASLVSARGIPMLITPWAANTELFNPVRRETPEVQALREELGLEAAHRTVLFTGSFRRWHGVLKLPAILERVFREAPQARAVLVGDGPDLPRVREELDRRGISERVRLTGPRPYEQVADLCALADVGIAPFDPDANPLFREYGFYYSPFKIFEYMASGAPVVTVDLPELREIVGDGSEGALAPAGNDAAFAEAVLGLLKDDAKRLRLGQRARAKAERLYSWEAHAAKIEEFLIGLPRRDAARSSPPAHASRPPAGT